MYKRQALKRRPEFDEAEFARKTVDSRLCRAMGFNQPFELRVLSPVGRHLAVREFVCFARIVNMPSRSQHQQETCNCCDPR